MPKQITPQEIALLIDDLSKDFSFQAEKSTRLQVNVEYSHEEIKQQIKHLTKAYKKEIDAKIAAIEGMEIDPNCGCAIKKTQNGQLLSACWFSTSEGTYVCLDGQSKEVPHRSSVLGPIRWYLVTCRDGELYVIGSRP